MLDFALCLFIYALQIMLEKRWFMIFLSGFLEEMSQIKENFIMSGIFDDSQFSGQLCVAMLKLVLCLFIELCFYCSLSVLVPLE